MQRPHKPVRKSLSSPSRPLAAALPIEGLEDERCQPHLQVFSIRQRQLPPRKPLLRDSHPPVPYAVSRPRIIPSASHAPHFLLQFAVFGVLLAPLRTIRQRQDLVNDAELKPVLLQLAAAVDSGGQPLPALCRRLLAADFAQRCGRQRRRSEGSRRAREIVVDASFEEVRQSLITPAPDIA